MPRALEDPNVPEIVENLWKFLRKKPPVSPKPCGKPVKIFWERGLITASAVENLWNDRGRVVEKPRGRPWNVCGEPVEKLWKPVSARTAHEASAGGGSRHSQSW